jgi:hypothetical protein
MKTLNQLIRDYTLCLRQGELQAAYKGILEFLGKLRADLLRKYPEYDVGGVYQGYMDMSYFSLGTKHLKDQGLKVAVVYLHEKGIFEVWLSARNRETARKFGPAADILIPGLSLFHDAGNPDAIVECALLSEPDFEQPDALMESIEQGVVKFIGGFDRSWELPDSH